MKQSPLRERIKRMLSKALPDFTFDEYPVLYLHPRDRNGGDLPAWSIVARRTSDGQLFDVYSNDTMGDCVFYGIKVLSENSDQAKFVIADRASGGLVDE